MDDCVNERLLYIEAIADYRQKKKMLGEWKASKGIIYDPNDLEFIHLTNELNIAKSYMDDANQWLNDANQRLNDANQRKKNSQEHSYAIFSKELIQKYVTIADHISIDGTDQLVSDVPTDIFGIDFTNGLFIRKEYKDIIQVISTKRTSNTKYKKVLIIGSPGIGKSVFGVLLFLLALKERKNVAYNPNNISSPWYFTWNGTDYDVSLNPLLDGQHYEGYFDGQENGYAFFGHVMNLVYLFASPRNTHYNDFRKQQCLKVYMNPWGKQECKVYNDLLHNGRTENDEWIRRFNLVGGKPRFLFSPAWTWEELLREVDVNMPNTLEELKKQVSNFDSNVFDGTMKNIIYSLYRDEDDCTRMYIVFSSLVIEKKLESHYHAQTAEAVRSLLQTPAPNLLAWRG